MRLTAEVVQGSPQHFNPAKQWTLNLRNYKINIIENLGATLNQFECIDLSDNDIRKVDGFPLLDRLKTLVLCNNRICRIDERLYESLPHLWCMNLINNLFDELGELNVLKTLPKLTHLYLMRNPVAAKKHYRDYLVHLLPQLRVLDSRRVTPYERDAARKLFKSKTGKQLLDELGRRSAAKTFGTAQIARGAPERNGAIPMHSLDEIERIKLAVSNATSLDEVERLNILLSSGRVPAVVYGHEASPTKQQLMGDSAVSITDYASADFVAEKEDDDDMDGDVQV